MTFPAFTMVSCAGLVRLLLYGEAGRELGDQMPTSTQGLTLQHRLRWLLLLDGR
jgi:hypothetical protein